MNKFVAILVFSAAPITQLFTLFGAWLVASESFTIESWEWAFCLFLPFWAWIKILFVG